MRTLQEKYNGVLEGKFSKTQFRRDAAIEMPQFVSTVNSFDDTVAILKNKGAITEAKTQEPKYSTAKPADTIAPDVLDTGIKFELDKKYGTLDVTPEQYEKAKEAAVKNLAKDVLYYVKQDSIQLDTPGEKMEKAKLREGKEEAWKEFQKKHKVTNKTIKVARKDFEKEWKAGNLNETVDTDELRARIANILKGQLKSLNKMGGDAIIEDYIETQIQAYLDGDVDIEEPMEVVNDFREYMDYNQSAAHAFNADLEPNDPTPESPKKDDDEETLEEDDEESPEEKANANAGSPMHAPPGLEEGEADRLAKLKQHRAQIMRDMEQEAEMEGGPIADRYGAMLDKIDKAIAQLQGNGKEREYRLMRENSIHSTEVEFILPIMHDKLGHPTERPAQSEIIDAAYQALSDWYPGDEVDVRHVEQLEKAYYADFDELVANTPDHSDYEMYENKRRDLKEMFKKIIVNLINE